MIETITDAAGFARLRGEWTALHHRSGSRNFFLTWEWLHTWWKHLAQRRRLMILTVRETDNRLIAIAPLCIRPAVPARLIPFRAVELLGTGTVGSDYLDLIIERGRESEAIPQIARHLQSLRLPLELRQLRHEGCSALALAERMAARGWRTATARANTCPYIRLAGLDWRGYLATLGAAHRANFHRRLRNLQRIAVVRFDVVRTDQERREALDRLIALHNERWRERGGSDAFHRPEVIAFHHELTAQALRDGSLRLLVLRVGPTPVAYFYGFRHGEVFSFYQSGFDPAWSGQSVGLVAMGLAIHAALAEGAAEFDLLHGAESYKYLWARADRPIVRAELHPPLLRGWITSGASELGRLARATGRVLLRAPGGGPLA